ncbi:MAG: tryptophan synthase subunit alpha [Alphaproteobacteria bacterium]|nr:tryptophan synthase subunit alpha [Alphaproteobacteria bacterium]MBV9370058.1 tryptophan synthase subunit alpha [Alphaproteobacteria bacterium]MBV9900732.1 tryptophan synthase subunit alpha [Alphaproteobacteria bacterium]
MSRYAAMFARLADRGEAAFGGFAMLGDPDLEAGDALLDALVAGGADMIEVGIPFSDPVADGPAIQAAAVRALAAGATPAGCFGLLAAFRARHPDIPVGILTYANLVVARGRQAFYDSAAAAGVDSVLVADVPCAEAAPFLAAAASASVDPVLIAAPNTPGPTLAAIAAAGRGYTYCVARAGVTGADAEVRFDAALIARLRALDAPPPVLGFGISRPEHVRQAIEAGAAGVISGSAIVSLAAERGPEAVRGFVAAMKAATRL